MRTVALRSLPAFGIFTTLLTRRRGLVLSWRKHSGAARRRGESTSRRHEALTLLLGVGRRLLCGEARVAVRPEDDFVNDPRRWRERDDPFSGAYAYRQDFFAGRWGGYERRERRPAAPARRPSWAARPIWLADETPVPSEA